MLAFFDTMLAFQVAVHLGVMGFFVDAKDAAAATYFRQFGFIPLPDDPLELFLPIETIRKAFQAG